MAQNTILRYGGIETLVSITEDEIVESFLLIVRYWLKYFKLNSIRVCDFWAKIFVLKDDNPQWNPVLFITEICTCTPISNTLLERLFNQMNILKSKVWNQLTKWALNALPCTKVSKVLIDSFHKIHVSRSVEYWFEKKGRRMLQGRRKCYQCRKLKFSKRPNFDFSTTSSSSSSENSESDIGSEVEQLILYNDISYSLMTLNIYF